MTIVDTGVLLALLDASHPRHGEAKRMLETGAITVTPPTLTEATRVIRRHAINQGRDGNAIARETLRILRSLPGYRLAPAPAEEHVARVYEGENALSYADAWNLVVSIEQDERLATFDKKLHRAARRKRLNE